MWPPLKSSSRTSTTSTEGRGGGEGALVAESSAEAEEEALGEAGRGRSRAASSCAVIRDTIQRVSMHSTHSAQQSSRRGQYDTAAVDDVIVLSLSCAS